MSISTQVDAVFSSLENSFGVSLSVSIVVNSAGILGDLNQTLMTDTHFEKIFDVNLKVLMSNTHIYKRKH